MGGTQIHVHLSRCTDPRFVPAVDAEFSSSVAVEEGPGGLESLEAFLDTPTDEPAPRCSGVLKLKKGFFWVKRRVVLGPGGSISVFKSQKADDDHAAMTVRDDDVWTTDGKVHMLLPVGSKLLEHVWRTTKDREGISNADLDAWVQAL